MGVLSRKFFFAAAILVGVLFGGPHTTYAQRGITLKATPQFVFTVTVDLDSVTTIPFQRAFGFNPYTKNRLAELGRQGTSVRRFPGFSATVLVGKRAVAKPNNTKLREEFARRLNVLVQSSPGSNIMALLFFVFRESIKEQNEDKKYWLGRLKEMNKIAQALADQLKYLNQAMRKIPERGESGKDRDNEQKKVAVHVKNVKCPISKRDKYKRCSITTRKASMSSSQIQKEISKIEAQRETVRNKRQLAASQFENANKIAGQYINMLASVLKTLNEMNKGIIRNLR